ncbi:MAG TPA: YsnF/AvaK domain-containing protein, partial [Gemmatimonadales bacterium]|nr:YsnF/AvaK domain-containing protein [Gemmatimonadales bacterium]
MAGKHQHQHRTIAGLFENSTQAENAVRQLEARGIDRSSIGIATRDRAQRERLDERTGVDVSDSATKAARGTHHSVMDTIKSWFRPNDADALRDEGLTAQEARDIEQGLDAGMILVVVDAGDRVDDVIAIFGGDEAGLGPPAQTGAETADRTRTGGPRDRTLELRGEELEVEKRQREAGEVRVRKEVVSEQRSIDVPVSREELVVERHPAPEQRAASGDLGEAGTGEEVRIPLREEEVEVRKRAVVREEVSLGKREVQGTEHVDETVRHEELEVKGEGDVAMR